jgi:hypothetical protein
MQSNEINFSNERMNGDATFPRAHLIKSRLEKPEATWTPAEEWSIVGWLKFRSEVEALITKMRQASGNRLQVEASVD